MRVSKGGCWMPSSIRTHVLRSLTALFTLVPVAALAQKPRAATYITDEEVKAVNATPGIDRTIRVVDIGSEHFAVGIIHRGATGGGARGTAAGGGAAAGAGARGAAAGGTGAGRGAAGATAGEPCGAQAGT